MWGMALCGCLRKVDKLLVYLDMGGMALCGCLRKVDKLLEYLEPSRLNIEPSTPFKKLFFISSIYWWILRLNTLDRCFFKICYFLTKKIFKILWISIDLPSQYAYHIVRVLRKVVEHFEKHSKKKKSWSYIRCKKSFSLLIDVKFCLNMCQLFEFHIRKKCNSGEISSGCGCKFISCGWNPINSECSWIKRHLSMYENMIIPC